jgi:phage major head subunit gpT-like protein
MEINQGNLDILGTGVKATFNQSLRATTNWFETIAQVEPSGTSMEQYFFREEIARMRQFKGEHIFRTPGFLGFVLQNLPWSDAWSVPLDAIADDTYGKYNGLLAELGEAAGQLPDDLGIQLIENGESSVCYDGQYFFDTDHPVSYFDASKGTQANLLTSKPLDEANFQLALAAMSRFKDATGRSMKIKADTLMVPSELEGTALKITDAQLTANGGTNIYNRFGVKTFVNRDLTHQQDWYILCTMKRVKPFISQRREAPKVTLLSKVEQVVEKRELKAIADTRYQAGYGRWQLIIKVKHGA